MDRDHIAHLAYRSVPVFPSHVQMQGFRWSFEPNEPVFMVDHCVSFGLASAPMIFHRISSAVARVSRRYGFKVVVYLDDFLVVGLTKEECLQAQLLISLLTHLGFAVSWPKVVTPTTCVSLLGYTIDSQRRITVLLKQKIKVLSDLT